MKNVRVRLTEFQIGAIARKLENLRETPRLCEQYGISPEEADALLSQFYRSPGVVSFDRRFRPVVVGELRNALDIAYANRTALDPGSIETVNALRSALAKIEIGGMT